MYTMKTFLPAAFLLTATLQTNAQADLCDNCYVWEFATDNGERDQTTRLLSNDVEDILSQYSGCKVLQRSRFARLQEQINNEKDVVQSLTGVRPEIKSELKTIQAKRVIFGTVNRDFQGNVSLRLSFENLQTTHVKSNTVFLINEDYYNFDKRKQKLTAFINSMINTDGKMVAPVQGGGSTGASSVECKGDNMPYTMENESVKIGLCQCYYYNKKITCPLWITNKSSETYYLWFNYNEFSRLILDYGKDYNITSATIMSNSSGSNAYVEGHIPVTRNGVPGSLTFASVQTESKVIESLEIKTGFGKQSFQDIPLVHGPPPGK
jgi:hypothetical protein